MNTNKNSGDGLSRRHFLAGAAAVPVAIAASGMARSAAGAAPASVPPTTTPTAPKKYPIGLELYSVRTELTRNPQNTLRAVAKMGYEVVEFYSPYAAWTPTFTKSIKTLMDDLGLRCFSTHNHIEQIVPGDGMLKAIELNQILGSRLLVLATAPGYANGLQGWQRLCGELTTAVGTFAPHGLSLGFHNHQTEWVPLDGDKRIMDVLAAGTPKEFVLQLDVGTCVQAGADPVAWIKANPGRIKSVHLKDWAPGTRAQEKEFRVLFGEGTSPWKEIFAAAESVGGVEFYLMEQEGSRFPEFDTAQKCLETWKTMRGGA